MGKGTQNLRKHGTDYTVTQVTLKDEDGSRIVRTGGYRNHRIYHVKQQYNKKFKRRKPLSKWQFLTKKAEELRKHPTESEIIFERKLKELGFEYMFQWAFLHEGIGGICDFYIHSCLLCIEIDGGYHLDQDQQQTDRVKDFIYKRLRKKVLRLTNQQALYLSIGQIKILIEAA